MRGGDHAPGTGLARLLMQSIAYKPCPIASVNEDSAARRAQIGNRTGKRLFRLMDRLEGSSHSILTSPPLRCTEEEIEKPSQRLWKQLLTNVCTVLLYCYQRSLLSQGTAGQGG
ncbi:hypothetical protein SL003B_1033 [Polymorphum gilvum SL003B-26A1]|uniref:Uncharacterized protein n=1 Tax=Polymorphum gilvum (strain LMG 25793 / CGMCC 1.9160 / SL003B-26A1) TaxID=991905 RepID=F2IYL5_POLGS|nr:hypothetical protein SL003B_1033 [Polymorphum gilvum SL003B-26A1]